MTDIEIPEGFTRWDGELRIPDDVSDGDVEVIHRCGATTKGRMDAPADWMHDGHEYDIIAYRVLP